MHRGKREYITKKELENTSDNKMPSSEELRKITRYINGSWIRFAEACQEGVDLDTKVEKWRLRGQNVSCSGEDWRRFGRCRGQVVAWSIRPKFASSFEEGWSGAAFPYKGRESRSMNESFWEFLRHDYIARFVKEYSFMWGFCEQQRIDWLHVLWLLEPGNDDRHVGTPPGCPEITRSGIRLREYIENVDGSILDIVAMTKDQLAEWLEHRHLEELAPIITADELESDNMHLTGQLLALRERQQSTTDVNSLWRIQGQIHLVSTQRRQNDTTLWLIAAGLYEDTWVREMKPILHQSDQAKGRPEDSQPAMHLGERGDQSHAPESSHWNPSGHD